MVRFTPLSGWADLWTEDDPPGGGAQHTQPHATVLAARKGLQPFFTRRHFPLDA